VAIPEIGYSLPNRFDMQNMQHGSLRAAGRSTRIDYLITAPCVSLVASHHSFDIFGITRFSFQPFYLV